MLHSQVMKNFEPRRELFVHLGGDARQRSIIHSRDEHEIRRPILELYFKT